MYEHIMISYIPSLYLLLIFFSLFFLLYHGVKSGPYLVYTYE